MDDICCSKDITTLSFKATSVEAKRKASRTSRTLAMPFHKQVHRSMLKNHHIFKNREVLIMESLL